MSTLAAVRLPPPKPASETEVAAVWRVKTGALMLLGRGPSRLPRSGTVYGPSDKRGMFRTLCWTTGERGLSQAFLAAVRLPDEASTPSGSILLLRGVGEGGAVRLQLPPSEADHAEFGQAVAKIAGRHAAPVARFTLEMLHSRGDSERSDTGPMLQAFLQHAAQPDGAIEIVGAIPDECVLLQGWGTRLTGPVQVVLAGLSSPVLPGHAGEFGRDDTPPPSCGTMIALPGGITVSALSGLDTVFIVSDAGLFARQVVGKEPLGAQASLGHLRHMMPSLRCPSAMQSVLRDLLRPRFAGVDTLAANPHPVRAAIDTSATGPAGTYLSGWVFDPLGAVAGLHLCAADGLEVRLDDRWSRVPRPDVSEAFRNDAFFPSPAHDDAGFAVSVPITLESGSYLRFTFADGEPAFVPITTTDIAAADVRARLVDSVDLYKPSGLPILKHQVVPLLARLRPATPTTAHVVLRGPTEREHAVVLPLSTPTLPRAFLSGLLHDPLTTTEQLVLVCGPEWNEPDVTTLCDLLRFYDLPATVLSSAETAEPAQAFREAARCTAASTFLLVGTLTCGKGSGWRSALREAGSAKTAFCSPTLLYEDWSIRFAGADETLVGMPGALATGQETAESPAGTLHCCLLRRSALAGLDGVGAPCTEAGREELFFLRLQQAGLTGTWLPSVQIYAPEACGPAAGRARELVDGWLLDMLRRPAPDGV